jgi:hypothetical protein
MLLLSSPAQAASVIGSSRIAARFADIPKFNPCSRSDARAVLDPPRMKGNSHFDFATSQFYVRADVHNNAAPAHRHWGSNGGRPV